MLIMSNKAHNMCIMIEDTQTNVKTVLVDSIFEFSEIKHFTVHIK